MAFRKRSRFERRSRARQQRVQQRLDAVGRGNRPARRISKAARFVLFGLSLLAGLGVAQVVTATGASWWSHEPAQLTAIAVQGTQRLSGEAVARSITALRGTDFDALQTEELRQQVIAHPWIRDARVAVLPTGTVIVDVEEREPRAILRLGAGDGATDYFVDASGVAFTTVEAGMHEQAGRLPLLMAETPEEGASLDDALGLLDRLDALALAGLAVADRSHRGLQLRLPREGDAEGFVLERSDGRTQVILGVGPDAVAERIERLERLLDAGLGELRVTTSIDMRFAGQAVLRTEGASG